MNLKRLFTGIISLLSCLFFSCESPFFGDVAGIFEVTFETNGGASIDSIRTDCLKKAPVTTKVNCDFSGWYDKSDMQGSAISFPYEVTENVTFYAKWNQKYTVTFETNGGTEVPMIIDSKLESVPQPIKENCTFAGWYITPDFQGSSISFPFTVEKDITLYAKWMQKYTVTFETNGGNDIESVKTGIITSLPEPFKNNYEFGGWYLNGSLTGNPIQVPYEVLNNIILYAKWYPTYIINFETDGGSEVPSFRSRGIENLSSPEKSGFTFLGWYIDSECNIEATLPMTLTENITLYAKWQQNYDVSFETNGGTSVPSIKTGVIYESPDTKKKDCSFVGWYTSSDFEDESQVTFPFVVNSNVTLYAKWNEQQVSITYMSNGATDGTVPSRIFVSKGSNITISGNTGNLVKKGYAFTKWFTSADGKSGQGYNPGQSIVLTKDIVLYAQWGTDYAAMVYVDGGTFSMGDPDNTGVYYMAHEVTLDGFLISKYEVTYEIWYEVYEWAKEHGYTFDNARKGVNSNNEFTDFQPATCISWDEAVLWCNAYSEFKGYEPVYYGDASFTEFLKEKGSYIYRNASANGYQLPTEAQWEYAAGGGGIQNRTKYAGTNSDDSYSEYSWYSGNSHDETHIIGTKKQNQIGLYDMNGNCWEWCFDIIGTFSSDKQNNPVASSNSLGARHIIKGGDYSLNFKTKNYSRFSLSNLSKKNGSFSVDSLQGSYNYLGHAIGIRLVRSYE